MQRCGHDLGGHRQVCGSNTQENSIEVVCNRTQPNRLLVVQTGESFEQAKVLKAHVVPQGLCANLINALKLLVNQQQDGYGLQQNIVRNLGMGSRIRLSDGLRESIKVDNERALDVGELRQGTGTFKVRKSKAPE